MIAKLLLATGALIYQILLVLLSSATLMLSLVNTLLRQLQQSVESEPQIHYEIHQHLHLESPSAYLQTVDNVSRHMRLPLPAVQHVPGTVKAPVTVAVQPVLAAYEAHRAA